MTSKHLLNKLIDELVHGNKPAKTLDEIVIDELLHTIVEGEFKPEKFIRYQVLPLLKGKQTRRKGRRPKRLSRHGF